MFHSYKDAENYVINSPARYVSKPNGDLAKELSYVSKGPADMVFMLRRWARTGKTVSEAKEAAHKVVKSLEIPNSVIYRTDIGDRLEEQLPSLQTLGFAEGLSF